MPATAAPRQPDAAAISLPRAEKVSAQIDRVDVVPLGVGEFEERLAQRHPGIGDQDVEIAKERDGVADHAASGGRI